MTARFDRVRRLTRDEIAWRLRAAARRCAQRAGLSVRTSRWDRHDLRKALESGVASGTISRAIAKADWHVVEAELSHRVRSRPARFVLDPATQPAMREAILARWPDASASARARADRWLAGEGDVLGYRGLNWARDGGDTDWHFDPVHNRRAPLVFWSDVPYLDPALGDHKVIWEINRHQHWLQLGRALWLTGDDRYGNGMVEGLESWLAANPPLVGINWASMLELGFRAMSWTWALHFLLPRDRESGSEDHPWLVDMLVGIDRQLIHLEQNLSHYFSPNTHLTGEALALYVVGMALPELAGGARWVETGRRVLLAEIDRQILADGGHVERSTHYQRYTLDFYLLALLTAQRAQDAEALAPFTDAVTRLADFTRTIADDQGRLPLIGDDDGGMLWPITGRACNDVRDSLALAAAVLGRPDLAPWGVPEEVFWIAGRTAAEREALIDTRATEAAGVSSRALADTGYVVARDGAGGHAVFDVGAHGYMNGGHAHADALAITLSVANRALLVDPGTSTYTMSPRRRDQMRGSPSHNTVTIDGRSQSIPTGPFNWRTRAEGRLHASRHNGAFDWAEASHDGYAPVLHRRSLVRTADAGWLVADEILGRGLHSAAAHWHFDPAWMVNDQAPGRLRATHVDGDTAWLLHDPGVASLVHGDEESGLGWYAPVYGTLLPVWTARITQQGHGPMTMVTWVGTAGPAAAEGPPSLERVTAECDVGGVAIAARVTAAGRTSVFLLRPGEPASRETRSGGVLDIQTNARVLHYVTSGDRLVALDLIDGSQLLALRDGWLSIAADDTIADLHVSIGDAVLDLWASTAPPPFRLQGAAVLGLRAIRLNGRELPLLRDGRTDARLIHSSDWGEKSFHSRCGVTFA